MKLSTETLKATPVFGIAGNFAEHLGQAGEEADFVNVETECESAPKGLFPIYIPQADNYLGVFPLSAERIQADFSHEIRLQVEPELALLLDVAYTPQGEIAGLIPRAFAAFNDCSNRINAPKISVKKNWGAASTGLSEHWIELDDFAEGGLLDQYHIACYLQRDGRWLTYGVDSPVAGYSYCHQTLMHWMARQFNQQQDFGPLERLLPLLAQAGLPSQMIVSLGATRYTSFGEGCFLQPGDRLAVAVYAPSLFSRQQLEEAIEQGVLPRSASCSGFIQTVHSTEVVV